MNRLNRRRFLALGAASTASVVLVGCGNESPSEADLNPTQMPDVAGAPPTLAPITSTPQADEGGGEQAAGGEGGGAAETLTMLALDSLAYDPSEAEVSPGQAIVLQNDGFLQHNLVVDEWGGELVPLLNNGETGEFTVPDDAEIGSEFVYYCSVPGHREGGMEGVFIIVEGGAAAAGGEEQAAAGGEEQAAAGDGEQVVIAGLDSLAYDPSELDVSPGQTLTMRNDGFLQHNLVVDEWGGELVPLLNNGETGDFTVPEDAEVGSSVEYYCSVPGHREGGMVGTFTVVEAGAAGGGDTAAAGAAEEEATAASEQDAGSPQASPAASPETSAASPQASPVASPEDAAAGGGDMEPITILALDSLAFDPNEVEVAPGQTIILENDGFLQHNLVVDEWGGELTPLLNNGETAEFTIPDDAEVGSSFEYYCNVPGHKEGGMVGTFTIV